MTFGTKELGTPLLIVIGVVAAGFFSSTFVINRDLSNHQGHWVWMAALRYFWTIGLLIPIIAIAQGVQQLTQIYEAFRRTPVFWIVVGTVGYGFFYTGITYSAHHLPAWSTAAIWQSTIVFPHLLGLLSHALGSAEEASAVLRHQSRQASETHRCSV